MSSSLLDRVVTRLGCSADRAAGLLAGVAGVEFDPATGSVRLVDLELAVAIRDACRGETEPRELSDLQARTVLRLSQRRR